MKTTEEFNAALTAWVAAVNTQVIDPAVNTPRLEKGHEIYGHIEVDPKGQKFLRIVNNFGGQGGVWAFVAKADGMSKTLGSWKQGDILRPATYKAPAKTARGNIFEHLPLCCISQWTGPDYMG